MSALFPEDVLVVPAGTHKIRANDTDYPFRPASDFAWMTGHYDADAVLVMWPSENGHETTLFVPEPSGRESEAFFTDSHRGELWVGRSPRLAEITAALGVATAPIDTLSAALADVDAARARLLTGIDAGVDGMLGRGAQAAGQEADAALRRGLSLLRLEKDEFELARIQDAVDATVRGFEDVVRELSRASTLSERWLEGTFHRRARAEGNDVAYQVIAAAGDHACTLHWVRNDGVVRPGDLVLIDAGVEGSDLYAADVTRTFPASGTFTAPQREVYEVVWEAQQAAFQACTPGNPFTAIHQAASRVLTEWLVAKGFLPCSVDEALEQGLHRRFTLHGSSHMLGLDVHDCAAAGSEYRSGELRPGMVLTVEPGCYFQPNDTTVPEAYRGIGVRIEDDVVITADGHRVMSEALPTKADDVQAWMATLRA